MLPTGASAGASSDEDAIVEGEGVEFVNEGLLRDTFADWRIEHLDQAAVPSDTRMLDVLVVRLRTDQN